MTTDPTHRPDQPAEPSATYGLPTPRPRRLRDCRPGDAAITQIGETVVLLHPTPGHDHHPDTRAVEGRVPSVHDLVEVYAGHRIRHLPGEALVALVTDPADQLRATRAALDALAQRRRGDVQTQDALRARHARVMTDIRAFAIERHLTGDTDLAELNEFLVHFGLGAYDPRLRVDFTITGSYEVPGEPDDPHDEATARAEAHRRLRAHLDDVTDLIPGTQTSQVHIDRITAIDTPTGS